MMWIMPTGKDFIVAVLIGTILLILIAICVLAFTIQCDGCQPTGLEETLSSIRKTNAQVETFIAQTEIALTKVNAPRMSLTETPKP
jgi:hypothetical protein